MRERNDSTSKSFVLLTVVTAFEKIIAFVYQAIVAALIGANMITDSFFASSELFTLIDSTLFGALVIILLNRYTSVTVEKGGEAGNALLSQSMSMIVPFALAISVLVFALADPLAYVLAPGFGATEHEIILHNIRLMSLLPVLLSITTIFLVILRQKRHFILVGLKSLFVSLAGITAVFFYVKTGSKNVNALSLGYIAATLGYCIATYFASRRYGKIRLVRPVWSDEARRIFRLMIPLMVSNGIVRISLMIDRMLSSVMGEGSVSCLTYSHTLYYFVDTFFVINICTILLTDFTNLLAEKRLDAIIAKVKNVISCMCLILLPITILTLIYHQEIVTIVFGRGNFGENEIKRVSGLIFFYAFAFVPSMIRNIYMQVHYAFGDTKTPMKNSLIAIGCNMICSIGLSFAIGLNGIALGTAVSTIVSMIIYSRSVKRFLVGYRGFCDTGFILRIAFSGALCFAAAYAVKMFANMGALLSFATAIVSGFGVYIIALLILREPVLGEIGKRILHRMKAGKNQ